ncbi:hypothetical protein [Nocardia pseudovaccinii]|uniref:hypothetical protein n=1 Tax=Nocardia pseudovaccinii TaxID=189540 RepID=UPI00157BC629|nr:hypothetical protein [Nocardia pseudovaccinii]
MVIPTGFGPGISIGDADLESLRRGGERILTEAIRVARTAAPGLANATQPPIPCPACGVFAVSFQG